MMKFASLIILLLTFWIFGLKPIGSDDSSDSIRGQENEAAANPTFKESLPFQTERYFRDIHPQAAQDIHGLIVLVPAVGCANCTQKTVDLYRKFSAMERPPSQTLVVIGNTQFEARQFSKTYGLHPDFVDSRNHAMRYGKTSPFPLVIYSDHKSEPLSFSISSTEDADLAFQKLNSVFLEENSPNQTDPPQEKRVRWSLDH